MIPVHVFAKCVKLLSWASFAEILRLTEHMRPKHVFFFTADKQISWIQI